jgi:hypothetical protein
LWGSTLIFNLSLILVLIFSGTVSVIFLKDPIVVSGTTTSEVNEADSSPITNITDSIPADGINFTNFYSNITQLSITNASNPSLTVSANNTLYLTYIMTSNNKTNLYLTQSSDYGKSFSEPVRVNTNDNNSVTSGQHSTMPLKTGPNDEIYVIWQFHDSSPEALKDYLPGEYPPSYLKFARSIDGGKPFEQEITLAQNETKSEKAFQSLSVSSNNTLYIPFLDSAASFSIGYPSSIKMLRSNDGGKSFEQSKLIDSNACVCCPTDSVIDDSDALYVLWRKTYNNTLANDEANRIIRDIAITQSIDGGSSFSDPTKVADDNWIFPYCPDAGPSMAFDGKGRLHVIWATGKMESPGYYYTYSDDKGSTFNKPILLLTDEWVPLRSTHLSVDGNDNVWGTWTDRRFDPSVIVVATLNRDGSNFVINNIGKGGDHPIIDSGKDISAIAWDNEKGVNAYIMSGPIGTQTN